MRQQANAAVDVEPDAAGRDDAFLGVHRGDPADGKAVAPVHVGHGQRVPDDAGQVRDVDELRERRVVAQRRHLRLAGVDARRDTHAAVPRDLPDHLADAPDSQSYVEEDARVPAGGGTLDGEPVPGDGFHLAMQAVAGGIDALADDHGAHRLSADLRHLDPRDQEAVDLRRAAGWRAGSRAAGRLWSSADTATVRRSRAATPSSSATTARQTERGALEERRHRRRLDLEPDVRRVRDLAHRSARRLRRAARDHR